jgi:isoleucyl-tRNA synthetase
MEALDAVNEDMNRIFLVSELQLETSGGEDLKATIAPAEGTKCARCWVYATTVGQSQTDPQLCHRCVDALAGERD